MSGQLKNNFHSSLKTKVVFLCVLISAAVLGVVTLINVIYQINLIKELGLASPSMVYIDMVIFNVLLLIGGVFISTLAINIIIKNMVIKPIGTLVKNSQAAVESGDFTSRIEVVSQNELSQLAGIFNQLLEKSSSSIVRIKSGVDNVCDAIENISSSTQEVNSVAKEFFTTIQQISQKVITYVEKVAQTSVAVKEMSSSIVQISSRAQGASLASNEVLQQAQSGGDITQDAVRKMSSVISNAVKVIGIFKERSEQIGEITSTITKIAGQTNLLAFNAAIEAARAGEAGRGFAIVGEEIRKLADSSIKSARRINDLVRGIQSEINSAVFSMETGSKEAAVSEETVDKVVNILNEIIEAAKRASDMVGEIFLASKRQEKGITEIVSVIDQICSAASEEAGITSIASSAAQRLLTSAQTISSSVEQFSQISDNLRNLAEGFKTAEVTSLIQEISTSGEEIDGLENTSQNQKDNSSLDELT